MINTQLNNNDNNLMASILLAQAKVAIIAEFILKDPRKHIKTLNQYKQFKNLVKKLDNVALTNKWQEQSRSLYMYLYMKQYVKKGGNINGNNDNKC